MEGSSLNPPVGFMDEDWMDIPVVQKEGGLSLQISDILSHPSNVALTITNRDTYFIPKSIPVEQPLTSGRAEIRYEPIISSPSHIMSSTPRVVLLTLIFSRFGLRTTF